MIFYTHFLFTELHKSFLAAMVSSVIEINFLLSITPTLVKLYVF